MLFSSYIFVFAFLPLTLAGYFLLSRVKSALPQRIFLIIASLVFYAWFEWKYIFLIASSILINYLIATVINRTKINSIRKTLFVVSVIFNVLLIGYFKYYDFVIGTINSIASTEFVLKEIVLPLGISFFTFQQISFLLYIYKNRQKKVKFLNYVLFVSFFAQLVAGPIVHYEELVPQIENSGTRKFNSGNFSLGLYMFTTGLFKKLVIADTVSMFVDNGFSKITEFGVASAWVVMLGYAFQIYFDFSGYSDMAIGLGKMFNFELPVNFNTPYRSSSVKEFWNRWHITLGKTLAETVYIPLGGGRRGKARKCLNLFITFLVSGIWHGASWTFIVWGVLHGIARVFEELFEKVLQKIPVFIRKIGTFLFVSTAFTIFRAETFSDAVRVYKGLFNFGNPGISQVANIAKDGVVNLPAAASVIKCAAIIVLCFILVFKERNPKNRMENFRPEKKTAVLCAAFFIISVLCMSRSAVFIYFNF